MRYLSNRSSGKMGYAIAEAALEAGHEVTLISGPVHLHAPAGAQLCHVTTSDEMFDAVRAAAARLRCARDVRRGLRLQAGAIFGAENEEEARTRLSLELVPTRDILASPREAATHSFLVVGFAAETEDLDANAQKKLREKNCDMIVANDVSAHESGMEC